MTSTQIQSLSAPYKHLYEIRNIKNIEYDLCTGKITNIYFYEDEPIVNTYRDGYHLEIFLKTNKALLRAKECPTNIFDMFSFDELSSLLTDEEFDIFCQTVMQQKEVCYDTEPDVETTVVYSDNV